MGWLLGWGHRGAACVGWGSQRSRAAAVAAHRQGRRAVVRHLASGDLWAIREPAIGGRVLGTGRLPVRGRPRLGGGGG
eukprot:7957683-Alexandrium_andersonii.AAC.1